MPVTVKVQAGALGLGGVRPDVWARYRPALEPAPGAARCARLAERIGRDARAVDLGEPELLVRHEDGEANVFGADARTRARIRLGGRASDWAMVPGRDRLVVAGMHQLAWIDTTLWEYTAHRMLPGAQRLLVSEDGGRVWAAWADEGRAGVAVFDPDTAEEHARLALGAEPLLLASSADARWLFAGTRSGLVYVIDAWSLEVVRTVTTAPGLVGLAWSASRGSLYAAHADGRIAVIDGGSATPRAWIAGPADTTAMGFLGDGRHLLLVSAKHLLTVLDTAYDRFSREAVFGAQPDALAFGAEGAWVHLANGSVVQLDGGSLREGERMSLTTTPRALPPGPGVMAGLGKAVAVATGDTLCVSDHCTNRHPAVDALLWREGLRQRAPGVWTGVALFDRPGTWDLIVSTDAPRVATCFSLDVGGTVGSSSSHHDD